MIENHWLAADGLGERLGLPQRVRDSTAQTFERWDGKGVPKGAMGEQILLTSRLVALADVVEVFHRAGGAEAAVAVARQRRGTQFDRRSWMSSPGRPHRCSRVWTRPAAGTRSSAPSRLTTALPLIDLTSPYLVAAYEDAVLKSAGAWGNCPIFHGRLGTWQAGHVVLPVHDENPLRRTPWVTYALVAANVIVLLLTPASRDSVMGPSAQAQVCSQTAFDDHYAAIPRELTTNHQLPQVATGQPGPRPDTCYVSKPPYHKGPSVLFAMFLHAGWLHLLGNMLFLIVFGNNIEDRLRKLPFLLFYLFCGYVAAYGFAFANQTSVQPLIGASGAIAGVLGAYLVIYPRAKVWSLLPFLFFIPVRIPAWLVLGSWFVLQWLYSAGYAATGGGDVAYLAHVFGFLAGLIVGLFVRAASPAPQYPVHPRYR